MKKSILLLPCILLSGCVSYSTVLVNKDGKTANCSGWAFGWATPIEMAVHHDCVKKAEAAGYVLPGAIETQKSKS